MVVEVVELEEELEFFKSNRKEWLEKYRDKYVLIKRRELIDVFATLEDAYKEGVKRFGNQPFLIKQVVEVEPVEKTPSLMFGIIHADL
jgi:fibrillarin-like rRNA methylase